jgi:hypothetical protein
VGRPSWVVFTHGERRRPAEGEDVTTDGMTAQEPTVHHLHPFTLRELEMLRGSYQPDPHARHARPRRRSAPWRRRVRAQLREHAQLHVFSVDEDEITAQLAHDGAR